MSGGADGARPRRALFAAILIPALLVALTGALVALDRPFASEPGGLAAHYLPPDGADARYRLQDGTVRTVEHARVIGATGALSGPNAVTSAVIGSLGEDELTSAHFWREVTTTADEQFNDLHLLGDDGLRQLAAWGGVVGFTFEPGLLVLPADVAPGEEWSSSGSALGDGLLTYESEFRASAADEDLTGADGEAFTPPAGCLRIDGTLTLEQPGAGILLSGTDTAVWCPGLGRVFSSGVQNEEPVGSVLVPDSTPLPALSPAAGDAAPSAADPRDLETLDTVVADAFFGDSIKQGSVVTRPAVTDQGLVVAPNDHGDDLLAWRLEGARAVLAWSAHPGGTIAAVSSAGGLVIAATEDRAVRAYDEGGRRLWSWEGDDLALAPAVQAPGSPDVLVATRGGTLARLHAEDGREVWSTPLGADVRGDFTVVGDIVVVADERGRVNGVDGATGEVVWRADLGMSSALSAPPEDAGDPGSTRVYVVTDSDLLQAVDARTGETLWDASLTGVIRSLVAGPAGVVAVTDEEMVRLASDGAKEWDGAGAESAVAAPGDRVLALRGRTVALLSAQGAVDDEWELPASEDPVDPHLLVSGDAAVVVGPALELWRMGLR